MSWQHVFMKRSGWFQFTYNRKKNRSSWHGPNVHPIWAKLCGRQNLSFLYFFLGKYLVDKTQLDVSARYVFCKFGHMLISHHYYLILWFICVYFSTSYGILVFRSTGIYLQVAQMCVVHHIQWFQLVNLCQIYESSMADLSLEAPRISGPILDQLVLDTMREEVLFLQVLYCKQWHVQFHKVANSVIAIFSWGLGILVFRSSTMYVCGKLV